MKWAILTSDQTRHRFLAHMLAAQRDVGVVVVEPKRHDPAARYANEEERSLLQAYFSERERAEAMILPEGASWSLPPGVKIREVSAGGINSEEAVSALQEAGTDAVVVFGTSILRDPWLSSYGGRMLNIHLGLSPYYRGSGTNFWALHDGRPELVGATLHAISATVDAGDVYCQVRPVPGPDDTPHSLGNKTIRRAASAMVWLMEQFEQGKAVASPVPLHPGSEYRQNDFNATALRTMLSLFERGMMAEYCANRVERNRAYPLVREWEEASG